MLGDLHLKSNLTPELLSNGFSIKPKPNKLVDFTFYETGIDSTKQFKSILVIKNNKLTSDIPRIKLANLPEVIGNEYNYVNIFNNKLNIAANKPSFELQHLTDVSVNLHNSVDKQFLTSNFHNNGVIVSNNNPYNKKYFFTYNLKPENLYLLQLEDITNTTNTLPSNKYIIRAVTESELYYRTFSSPFVTDLYRLEYDKNPTLSNNLNCNYKAFYNRKYRSKYINSTALHLNLDISLSDYLSWVCELPNLKVLNLNFIFKNTSALFGLLILKNFSGFIAYPNYVKFENGIKPRLEGYEHVLGLIQTNNTVTIIQKSTNLFNETN